MDKRPFRRIAILGVVLAAAHAAAKPPDSEPPALPASPSSVAADGRASALEVRVAELIEQLGDDKFIVRQQAERALLALGHDAFDQLKAAESDPDPEVAARAQFLARRLTVDWIQPGDSPQVRELMDQYGALEEEDRQAIAASLPSRGPGALAALCRIVRFDASDFVSRYAALVIANAEPSSDEAAAERAAIITEGVGRSSRVGARWLRTYLVELRDPVAALAEWREHTEAQRTLSDRHAVALTVSLLRQQANILGRLDRESEMLDAWFEMLALDANETQELLTELVTRLIKEERWDAIDRVVEAHRDRFRAQPALLYLVAEARLEQGQEEKAQATADEAFEIADNVERRLQVGHQLVGRGRFAWGEREYREVIDKTDITSVESIYARSLLAAMLYDHERFQDAADLFSQLLTKAKSDKDARGALDAVPNMDIRRLAARNEYYLACKERAAEAFDKSREHLDKAIKFDPTDIDVLIAMYHLPNVDDAYRKRTRTQIDGAASTLDRELRRNPDEAVHYNNWAWLIANTEGDTKLAVERAEKAVRLADEDSLAGHLDTLARCHFANGDIESAIEHQERAVALDPHTRQLSKQLEVFEKALADKNPPHASE